MLKNKFDIGDLVKHRVRGYFGVIIKALPPEDEEKLWLYKVGWQHGHWMFELESQLQLEEKAHDQHKI